MIIVWNLKLWNKVEGSNLDIFKGLKWYLFKWNIQDWTLGCNLSFSGNSSWKTAQEPRLGKPEWTAPCTEKKFSMIFAFDHKGHKDCAKISIMKWFWYIKCERQHVFTIIFPEIKKKKDGAIQTRQSMLYGAEDCCSGHRRLQLGLLKTSFTLSWVVFLFGVFNLVRW